MRGESQRYQRETPGYRYTESAEYPSRGRRGPRYDGWEDHEHRGPRYDGWEESAHCEPAGHRYAGPEEHEHRGPRYDGWEESAYREPTGHRYAGPEEYQHRGRPAPRHASGEKYEYYNRAPAAWDYWDEDDDEDEEYSGRAGSATGGAGGNERLTGLTGMVLLVLFAAEGFTILAIHQMLTLHFFLGVLLVGPVLLKMCSTGYRFARYYTGDAEYRRKGPPALLLRMLGPFVILTSLLVIGTGVMLAFTGPGPSIWLLAHKASFVLWFGAMTVHVLAYVWRLPQLVGNDLASRAGRRAEEVLGGRAARWLLLTASLLAGLLLAVITVHLAGPWVAAGGGAGG
jgi:hypothetical protein